MRVFRSFVLTLTVLADIAKCSAFYHGNADSLVARNSNQDLIGRGLLYNDLNNDLNNDGDDEHDDGDYEIFAGDNDLDTSQLARRALARIAGRIGKFVGQNADTIYDGARKTSDAYQGRRPVSYTTSRIQGTSSYPDYSSSYATPSYGRTSSFPMRPALDGADPSSSVFSSNRPSILQGTYSSWNPFSSLSSSTSRPASPVKRYSLGGTSGSGST